MNDSKLWLTGNYPNVVKSYLCVKYDTVVQVGSVDGYVDINLGAALLGLPDGEHHAGEVERWEGIIVPHLVCKICGVYSIGRSTHHYQRLPGLGCSLII